MKIKLYNFFFTIFLFSLLLFILIGFIIVIFQIAGIFIGSSDMVLNINSALKKYAIWVSSISGFCGFICFYLK